MKVLKIAAMLILLISLNNCRVKQCASFGDNENHALKRDRNGHVKK